MAHANRARRNAAADVANAADPVGSAAAPLLAERLRRWEHTLGTLRGPAEGVELERRWVLVSALQASIRRVDASRLAPALGRELAAARRAADSIAEQTEARLSHETSAALLEWFRLLAARHAAERRVVMARAALEDVCASRSRHVRRYFALGLPVPVVATEGLAEACADVAATRACVARVEERLEVARAACPPEPSTSYHQTVSDVKGGLPVEFAAVEQALPRDVAGARRGAEDAREVLARTPRAGREPLFVDIGDLPFLAVLQPAPFVLAGLAVPFATYALIQGGSDAGAFVLAWPQAAVLSLLFGAVAIGVGMRAGDAYLRGRYAAWSQRARPIDHARIAIVWHYLVARGEVEQREDELAAVVELERALLAQAELDASPERAARLAALRAERPELAVQVELAARDVDLHDPPPGR